MSDNNHADGNGTTITCSACALRRVCFQLTRASGQADLLERLICRSGPHPTGSVIAGDDGVLALGVVRSGAVVAEHSGRGTVRSVSVYLPGELFGFEAFGDGRTPRYVATEPVFLCRLPVEPTVEAGEAVACEVIQLAGKMFAHQRSQLEALRNGDAATRVAGWLLDISRRWARSGRSAQRFPLPVTRQRWAAMIGLAPGTLSRILAHLEELEIARFHRHQVDLLDAEALAAMAGMTTAH